ncbi:MAG TPA: carboxypeptidase regulatory-like domain-containing protein [Planctomycetota bacterium]|nr:carboxypeptidase regulatory-like domain-containing protein [Planctomycetota bacterium]
MRSPPKPLAIILLACLIAFASVLTIASCRKKPAKVHTGGEIHGSIVAMIKPRGDHAAAAGMPTHGMKLPELTLELIDKAGTVVSTELTDLQGRFVFATQKPGTYRIRWNQRGFVAGAGDWLTLRSHTLFLNPLKVAPFTGRLPDGTQRDYVAGRVRLIGGGSPWFHDDAARRAQIPEVAALDAGGTAVAPSVHTNINGEFLIVDVPRADVRVRATLDGAQAEVPVPAAQLNGGTALALTFANHRPDILVVRARDGAREVRGGASSGATLKVSVSARDPDGDPLTYTFLASDGGGSVVQDGSDTATWTLPAHRAKVILYVTATDGKGGFAKTELCLTCGREKELFGARVVDDGGAPVANAEVEVNGEKTRTRADGTFRLLVKPVDRYVLNVRASGFALMSRILDRGTSRTWQLVRARTQSVDPKQPIRLTDTGDDKQRDRSPWLSFALEIPADALVDGGGAAPTGNLTASYAVLDIARGEMPGDWAARDGGTITNLKSFGGAFVEFTDAAGAKFNLKLGTEADVRLAAPPTLIAIAPPQIPLWSYGESDGVWEPNGAAQLQGGEYVGKVKHFSTLNADVKFSASGCLSFKLDNPTMAGKVKVRVTDPTGTAFSQAFEFILDSEFNALYRLPDNTDVKVELRDDLNQPIGNVVIKDAGGTVLPGGIINTGGPVSDPFPAPDSGVCTLVRIDLALPPWAGAPGIPFLNLLYHYDPAEAALNEARTDGYYAKIDPNGERDTLGEWWAKNGFDAATGEAADAHHATYLNNNDLGFGRDMHMRVERSGATVVRVAAYVTNYGDPDQSLGNVNQAADVWEAGIDQAERDDRKGEAAATVCMEYAVVEGVTGADATTKVVKFFAYGGGLANAPRIKSADLDQQGGQKFIPMLCQNCHGSTDFYAPYPTGVPSPTPAQLLTAAANPSFDDINMGASFREFDITTFRYAGANPDNAGAQKDDLRLLNGDCLASAPSAAIRELIQGWHPPSGGALIGTNDDPVSSWRPSGFSGSPENTLYDRTIAKSCRTCHVAFPNASEAPGEIYAQFAWDTYEQLKARQSFLHTVALCGGDRTMPHALITYQNYWLLDGGQAAATLNAFSDGSDWPAYNCAP